jgi:hypothetical protein
MVIGITAAIIGLIILILAYIGIPMSVQYVYVAFELKDPEGLQKALKIQHHCFKKAKFSEEDDEEKLLLVLHVAIATLPLGNMEIPSLVISSYLAPLDNRENINGYVIHRYFQPHKSQAMFPEITDFVDIQVEMKEEINFSDDAIKQRTITAKAVDNGKVLLDGQWKADFSKPIQHLSEVRFGNRNGWIHTITGARNNVYSPVSAPSVYGCETIYCTTNLPNFSSYVNPQPVGALTHKPGAPFKWKVRIFRMVFDQIVRKRKHL